ncbi:MAG: AAA family ATPase, partial [Acidimicrobiales bacterium]
FKSFRDAVLPLDPLTLVVGRNGSGKSNALDGLWVLSRLAEGEDIRDALDGGRDGPAVRGGVAGAAPLGRSAFALGCRVRTGAAVVELDVTVQTEPDVQVVSEHLRSGDHDLLVSEAPRPGSADLGARWGWGDAPAEPTASFRASRLLTTQVLSRVPATEAGRSVHLAAGQVLGALRSVFVLDPVPDQMRQYVPRRDVLLRRNAGNLSAAVATLLDQPGTRDRLREALGRLNEQEVTDLTTSRSDLDDLMLTLVERFAGHEHQVPARVMSDGSLRFLAILVALMQAPALEAAPERAAPDDAAGQTTLVIEELENGLHASQAAVLVGLIRDEVNHRRVRALATAHSPALLDALTGDEHRSVIVCQRSSDGHSTLTRLLDLPNYLDVVAGGGLGRAAVKDRLRAVERPKRDATSVLAEILGRSPR